MMSKTSLRTATLLFTVFLSFGQLGCFPKEKPVTKPPTLGTSYGRILVDSPEVYGRERLARDRLEHKQWLEGQLATVDQADYSKFQGATQQRSLDSTRFRAGIDARIQTALQIQQTRNQAEALGRQAHLEELRHEIEVRKLEQELDALEQQTGEDVDGDGGDDGDSGGDGAGTPTSVLETLLADTLAADPGQLPDTGIATTDLADRPLDVFLEKLAFRERIRQELLENNLDDVHDLDGNTLYRLTFDTTVFPENDTSAWAVVEVELEDPFQECSGKVLDYLRPIWERWLDALQVRLNDEVDQLQDLILEPGRSADLLSERERRFVARALAAAQSGGERVPERATRLESLRSLYRGKRQSYLAEPRERKESGADDRGMDFVTLQSKVVRQAALEVIRDEYQSTLNPQGDPVFVEIRIDDQDEKRLLTCAGPSRAQHVSNFCKALQRRRQAGAISAYAITPKVTAERVSSVRAGRAARELALGLAATAGPVQFQTAYEKAQLLDAATQAILHRPLVVAFSDVIDPLRLDSALPAKDELLDLIGRAEEAAESARAASAAAFGAATEAVREVCASASDRADGAGPRADACRKPSTQNELRFEEKARPIFGWILGPRFQTRHEGAGYDFRFAPHSESLSAVLSVPAWWPRAHLKVRTCWVREDHVPRGTARICAEPSTTSDSGSGSSEDDGAATQLGPFLDRHAEYSVRLGGNNHAITTALAPSRRQPSARLSSSERLEVGRAGKLVLVGTELWRNPTVTVGTQTADRIDILPDMEGLIATFDSVVRPAGWTSQQRLGREQVWLWTSEGRAYAGIAEIYLAPAASTTAPAAQFSMTAPVSKLTTDSKNKALVAVDFQAKEDKPEIVFGVESAEIESFTVRGSTCKAGRQASSLTIQDLAKGQSCTVDLVLRNVAGETITLTSFQKIGNLKGLHPSITLLVD